MEASKSSSATPNVRGLSVRVLGLLFLALAIVVGVYWYTNGKMSQKDQITTTKQQAQVSVTPPADDETVDWKTYDNKDYSFKYPQDWELNTGQNVLLLNSPDYAPFGVQLSLPKTGAQIEIRKYAKSLGDSVQEPKLTRFTDLITQKGVIAINGREVYQLAFESDGTNGFKGVDTFFYYPDGSRAEITFYYALKGAEKLNYTYALFLKHFITH